jgi:hypothetical protein
MKEQMVKVPWLEIASALITPMHDMDAVDHGTVPAGIAHDQHHMDVMEYEVPTVPSGYMNGDASEFDMN